MGYLAYNNQATFYHVQKFFEFRNKKKLKFLIRLLTKNSIRCRNFLKLTEIINSNIGRNHKMEMKL